MRLVQLMIPTGTRETILGVLDDEGIDYVVTDETSSREYTAVVYFPLPSQAVEPILDSLQDAGIEENAYTVVVDAETVISKKFEELQGRYENGNVGDDRISRQELRTEAEDLTPTFSVYVTMTVISALVATAGLLLDSPAVVVGSMVIAPLIGPALGASIGTVIDEPELLIDGAKYQALGVGLAIGAAAVMAWFVRVTNVVPPGMDISEVGEIAERLTPDLLSLVIALGAGVAGVLSVSTGTSVALVGVMIAAALIPPAAAAGIAIAFGEPGAALGATALVSINVLSVNLAGLVTLWYSGYRPDTLFGIESTQKRVRRQAAGLAVVVLVFSAFLGGITYSSYVTGTFEEDARSETELVLDEQYEDLMLLDLSISLDQNYPFRNPERVVVSIGGPPGGDYPELADTLHDRIEEYTDESIAIELRHVQVTEGN